MKDPKLVEAIQQGGTVCLGDGRHVTNIHDLPEMEETAVVNVPPAETPQQPGGAVVEFDKLTVAELKAKAEELGLAVPDGAKKAELVALLEAQQPGGAG